MSISMKESSSSRPSSGTKLSSKSSMSSSIDKSISSASIEENIEEPLRLSSLGVTLAVETSSSVPPPKY